MEAFPDLVALSDADLKELTEEKMAEERDVSRRRRQLHGRIDLLRVDHTRRLKASGGGVEVDAEIVSEELLTQLPEELAVLADDDLLPTGEETEDAAELSDDELRERDGEASEHLAASDVDMLSEILSHRGPPLELPAELKRLD